MIAQMELFGTDLDCAACEFPAIDPVEIDGRTFCRGCAPKPRFIAPAGDGPQPRPYQREAVDAVFEQFQAAKRTLIVSPTGTGKTCLFAETIRRWPEEDRVLVMAHRDELIQQAVKKIEWWNQGIACDVEMGEFYADRRTLTDRARVVVTSVQTMSRTRRHSRFHPDEFGLFIIDEAHHATASTYKAVLEYFGQNDRLKVLGVTATPDRADEAALGQIFETVAYDYQLVQAIEDGWLVPIQQQFVQVAGLDLSAVKTTAGDLNAGQLAKIVEEERVLHEFASPTIELSGTKKTLVFTASVEQAERLSEIFNRHRPGCSEWICGDQVKCPMDRRREILRQFSLGSFQYLVNCGVLLEGYDEPTIEVVAVARPTKSRSLYAQIVGRGTRPLSGLVDRIDEAVARRAAIAASSKPSMLVLDFVGNSGKHKLIHTGDLLGGNYDDEVVAAATKAVRAKSTKGERADMLEELRRAEEERAERKRQERARVLAKAKFTAANIDPFACWDILPKREPGWHQGRKPTAKQLAYLEKQGMPTKDLSFCQANQLITESIQRRDKGLCTFKQAKILAKHGFATNIGFQDASALIDKIAASGWKLRNTEG